jgi:hypothetical protein
MDNGSPESGESDELKINAAYDNIDSHFLASNTNPNAAAAAALLNAVRAYSENMSGNQTAANAALNSSLPMYMGFPLMNPAFKNYLSYSKNFLLQNAMSNPSNHNNNSILPSSCSSSSSSISTSSMSSSASSSSSSSLSPVACSEPAKHDEESSPTTSASNLNSQQMNLNNPLSNSQAFNAYLSSLGFGNFGANNGQSKCTNGSSPPQIPANLTAAAIQNINNEINFNTAMDSQHNGGHKNVMNGFNPNFNPFFNMNSLNG